jgi:pimeloyl-ACP methyl ester carboxylesterase
MSNGAARDNLIPRLADRYRVIAPDHLGFGLSDAPPVDEFDYTFDALTDPARGATLALEVVSQALRAFRRRTGAVRRGCDGSGSQAPRPSICWRTKPGTSSPAASLNLQETAIARTGHPDGAFGCVV